MNETSLETYRMIQEDGTLNHTQLMVYSYLLQNGKSTDRQIQSGLNNVLDINCITGRRNDLLEMGIVRQCGKIPVQNDAGRIYPHTLWELSPNLTALKIKTKSEIWHKRRAKVYRTVKQPKVLTLAAWC